MMTKISVSTIWIMLVMMGTLLFAETDSWMSLNTQRSALESKRKEKFTKLPESDDTNLSIRVSIGKKKNVKKAIILSALVPGAGEAYSESWIKAAGFFAAEVAFWTFKSKYHSQGDDKDAEMRAYADTHWSENRYWTYVYIKGKENGWGDITYSGNIEEIKNSHGALPEDFINQYIDVLRQWERNIATFTHELPETKTQQYYEMIGKYSGQFGPAWDDASYEAIYNGYINQITANNKFYMDLRKEANDLYDRSRLMARFILLNHFISAIDAGFTAKFRNRNIDVKLSSELSVVNHSVTEFIGLHCTF
ncbi:MAG: hypothetical protein Kow00108_24630 [Calditrichia bacterium]